MTDQLSKLASRLREMAHDIPDTFSGWDADDLDHAADLIDSMAQRENKVAATLFLPTPYDKPIVTGWNEHFFKVGEDVAVYLAPVAQREPLSNEQIEAIVREHSYIGMGPLKFVRLIEQAHDIRRQQ